MELHLDRKLSEKRIFPAVDIYKSGTRKEELLLTPEEKEVVWAIRRSMNRDQDVTETVLANLVRTENNQQFVAAMQRMFWKNQKN